MLTGTASRFGQGLNSQHEEDRGRLQERLLLNYTLCGFQQVGA